jgi:hypothetical protein
MHPAPNTTSNILAKSISKEGGVMGYRGLVRRATTRRARRRASSARPDGTWPDTQIQNPLELRPTGPLRGGLLALEAVTSSGRLDGSSTIEEKSTARQAARGRRAHQRCSVEGCPWRIDFSRADSRLIASSGSATSISFLR